VVLTPVANDSLVFGNNQILSPNIKHMKTNVVKNITLSLMITALSAVIPASSVSAQSSTIQQSSETSADIKYVGNNTDFFKFEVNLKNQGNQKLSLRILDENGVELYYEAVSTKEFSKIVKVPHNDYARLQFIVSGKGASFAKSFSINAEVTDNFIIRELND
jgi:hypothetical protein